MVLLCLSDIHGHEEGLSETLSAAGTFHAIVLAGDLTHLGGRTEAQGVLDAVRRAGKPVFAVPGNMDRREVLGLLEETGLSIHGRAAFLDGIGFFGLGGCNPSPFGTPFELKPDEAAEILRAGSDAARDVPVKVLVSHAPPRGTRLDRSFAGLHVGSAEVKGFLEGHRVDLCLCGHIHESAGEDTVGGCHCVNVGPWKDGRYALVSLEPGSIRVDWRSR